MRSALDELDRRAARHDQPAVVVPAAAEVVPAHAEPRRELGDIGLPHRSPGVFVQLRPRGDRLSVHVQLEARAGRIETGLGAGLGRKPVPHPERRVRRVHRGRRPSREDPDPPFFISSSALRCEGDDEGSHGASLVDERACLCSVGASSQEQLKAGWQSAGYREKVQEHTSPQGRRMQQASGAGTPEVEIRLLGPVKAEREGQQVGLGGPKPRTLLAVLALEPGRVVSVDRLVEALWPGEPPETAAHAVQVYVSQLRKALGPVIATRPPGYELELAPDRVDVNRFTRLAQEGRAALAGEDPVAAEGALREALALWRGPALADFLYEPFAQNEIARLEDLRTVALEERIAADLALGRHAELVSELEALVQAQPLRERPRAQLMLALYRSGRQADALAAYRAARETLVEELGIDPGPELRELEAAILRQDDSLLLEATSAVRPAMQFRRLATILFVDVVDSMAMTETMDPEALMRVQRSYFEAVAAAIGRHGGTVEKYAGDAVMAAFGVPISHEDDALRAARAAFDIKTAVEALNGQLAHEHDVRLDVRIGLAAGEVVAEATGSGQRFVAGDAVGVAARLQQAAAPGEIFVGEIVARLVDHSARLEPLGALDVESRKQPIATYRLVELVPAAPAFERRQDAKLVGRKRELAALRRMLKLAVDYSDTHVAVVVGSPGVGKSRLAVELTRRAKGVTALWGRCLAYGDGITYWPLREVLEQAGEGEERDAVLAALDAETPPPAAEIAWLFRQFCGASARERPLVLVFDDVHWAEPTFLELVEHLTDKGTGPIAVVCLAREELLDDRPSFLEGRANATRILLDALSAGETDALLDGLGGTNLESDQRARIVEAAEGNPLFLEQLLALALEGGLAARPFPETIQALLAARLDRLGPGERAVLERGAVVGKEFSADDVIALLDPDAAPTARAHLETLAGRGFVRPRGGDAFGFRHVLVQDAVYRAAPKRLRAELHERYADRLDTESPELPDLDEFVGYHLEQAFRLRTELGESDRHARRLAEESGQRLAVAGMRAYRRGDHPAIANLLERATSLLPTDDPLRRELLCNLGIARAGSANATDARTVLEEALRESLDADDRRIAVWARVELEYFLLRTEPGRTGDELLAAISKAVPIAESVGDQRVLGRSWLINAWFRGGRRCDHRAWEDGALRSLGYYKALGWGASGCVGELAAALYWGPTPVADGIARCERLLRDEALDRMTSANLNTFLGGLHAQQGDFSRGRALVGAAQAAFEDLGMRTSVVTYCTPVLSEVELSAGEPREAARLLDELCKHLDRSHQFSRLASAASELAGALTMLGAFDEADRWIAVAESHTAADDLHAQIRLHPVRAKIHAHNGDLVLAEDAARTGVNLAESTDDLNRRARAHLQLGDVLRLAGDARAADSAFHRAIELYEQKGNVVAAEMVRVVAGAGALV
jgi:DNA-binding SARP family transcriptional activator